MKFCPQCCEWFLDRILKSRHAISLAVCFATSRAPREVPSSSLGPAVEWRCGLAELGAAPWETSGVSTLRSVQSTRFWGHPPRQPDYPAEVDPLTSARGAEWPHPCLPLKPHPFSNAHAYFSDTRKLLFKYKHQTVWSVDWRKRVDSQMTLHKYTKASVESQNKTTVFKSQVEEATEKRGEAGDNLPVKSRQLFQNLTPEPRSSKRIHSLTMRDSEAGCIFTAWWKQPWPANRVLFL